MPTQVRSTSAHHFFPHTSLCVSKIRIILLLPPARPDANPHHISSFHPHAHAGQYHISPPLFPTHTVGRGTSMLNLDNNRTFISHPLAHTAQPAASLRHVLASHPHAIASQHRSITHFLLTHRLMRKPSLEYYLSLLSARPNESLHHASSSHSDPHAIHQHTTTPLLRTHKPIRNLLDGLVDKTPIYTSHQLAQTQVRITPFLSTRSSERILASQALLPPTQPNESPC